MNAINRFRRSIHKVIGKEQRPNSNIANGPNPFVYTYVCVCVMCVYELQVKTSIINLYLPHLLHLSVHRISFALSVYLF